MHQMAMEFRDNQKKVNWPEGRLLTVKSCFYTMVACQGAPKPSLTTSIVLNRSCFCYSITETLDPRRKGHGGLPVDTRNIESGQKA